MTELLTLMNSKELIHATKCAARNAPESAIVFLEDVEEQPYAIDRMLTHLKLAGKLGLAVNTVARAYRELETAGIVETRGRFGTFVARADPADAAMAAAANAYAETARTLGVSKPQALRYLEAAFE